MIEIVSIDWDGTWSIDDWAKRFLRLPQAITPGVFQSEGGIVKLLTHAAIQAVQNYTRRTFVKTRFRQRLKNFPCKLNRFPVLQLESLKARIDGSYVDVSIGERLPFISELTNWTSGNWNYFICDDIHPPILHGSPIPNAIGYEIEWTAGYACQEDWPKDLWLLVFQIVEENFDNRGSTPVSAQAIQFSSSHKMLLEQYVTHHDSIGYA